MSADVLTVLRAENIFCARSYWRHGDNRWLTCFVAWSHHFSPQQPQEQRCPVLSVCTVFWCVQTKVWLPVSYKMWTSAFSPTLFKQEILTEKYYDSTSLLQVRYFGVSRQWYGCPCLTKCERRPFHRHFSARDFEWKILWLYLFAPRLSLWSYFMVTGR